MKTNIFEPLAISDLTMFPSSDLQKRLAGIWHRNEDGTLEPRAFPLSRPLNDSGSDVLNSGGAGLYGTLKDYSSRHPHPTIRPVIP